MGRKEKHYKRENKLNQLHMSQVAVTQKVLKCYRDHLLECHTAGLAAEIFCFSLSNWHYTKIQEISRYASVLTTGQLPSVK